MRRSGRELQRRCVRHILKRQLPDGGWNIYHGGPSEINASVKAYFALKLAGCSVDAPFMQEARATIMRLGGIPQMNTFSKLYLALLGVFPGNICRPFRWKWCCYPAGRLFTFTKCPRGAGPCSFRCPSSITSNTRGFCPGKSNSRAVSSRHRAGRFASVSQRQNSGLGAISSFGLDDTLKLIQPLRVGRCGNAHWRQRSAGCSSASERAVTVSAAVYPAMLNCHDCLRSRLFDKTSSLTQG